jgi:hypothetical protein
MKIGINLVGVSYTDKGRLRDYKKSYDSFFNFIVNPLKEQGHDVIFYVTTYDSDKRQDLELDFNPKKSTFLDQSLILLGGGDKILMDDKPMLIMIYTYLTSLLQLENEDLDLVISTRFDINFQLNPLQKFNFDFTKFNFIFKDFIHQELPLVCDCFYVYPYHMNQSLITALYDINDNPYKDIQIGMLNMYNTLSTIVGKDKVNIACEEFLRSDYNYIYTLTRNER